MEPAYRPIVTVQGEVLHRDTHTGTLWPTDLLLCDVGAETPEGWACDVTRTWPTAGRFSTSQRAMYEVVLAAQIASIQAVRPGIRFRDVHAVAARHLLEGLVDLGVLRGNVDSLEERGAHTLFFVHGVGHLLGLDVHDMEDLGEDQVGYGDALRSSQFGLKSLRLVRPLEAGFVVTVEPGIYFIPELIDRWRAEGRFRDFIAWDRLEAYRGFGGLRNEEDFVITPEGARRLGKPKPRSIAEIEALRA